MSTTTTETTADATSGDNNVETSEATITTTATTTTTNNKQADNKSMKKVRSKKDLKNDPGRFESPGVNFNAKLIGIDEVMSARGDKMCQESIQRLKLAVKSSGQHKQKIIVNVSLEGVRLIDLRSQAVNHTHLVHRISFISRDITDSRAFGYVYGAGEGKHKFYAIKTEKAAEALVLTLRDLFQVVYDTKKKEVEEAKQKQEETVEKAEEAKDSEEPVYQVPKSGAPVENPEDPTYQVPTNNAPVNKNEDNLLNLENELESIEKGIEQMNDLEDMFSDLRSPSTTNPQSPSTWGDELSSLAQPPASTQPAFSMGGAPFSAPASTMPPAAGGAMFGQPGAQSFPAARPQPGGFGHQPWDVPAPQPGMAPGTFPGAAPNPFGAPNIPPRAGPGMLPPPVGHPHPHTGHPHPGGFPPTPFPGPGQLSRPNFPALQPQTAPAAASDPFGNDPFAMGDSGGFGDNLLTPDKIEMPQEEAAPEVQGKKDAFGDLVEIGTKDKHKSPKQMFVDLAAPPKKSLNELKVEKAPSPKPASPGGFQASEAPEGVSKGNAPSPADFSTLGPLGNPFGTGDPFASLVPNMPAPSNQNQNALAQNLGLSAQNNTNSFSAPSQKANLGASIFDDDFNLPAPKGAPPPLPVTSGNVSASALIIPPPPPRTNVNTLANTQNTPPLPPRPTSVSSGQKSSKNTTSGSKSVSVPHTPPLPPRLYLQSSINADSLVPNTSLSKEVTKDKESNNTVINKLLSELPADSTKCSDILAKPNKSDNTQDRFESSEVKTQTVVNKVELSGDSLDENGTKGENAGNFGIPDVNSNELCWRVSHEQIRQDKNEFSQISPKGGNSVLSDLEKNAKNHISDQNTTNLIKDDHITSENGANLNGDTDRISVNSASFSYEDTTDNKSQTDTSVVNTVDLNSNKMSFSSVSDPFVSIDPFTSEDPFAQADPFSADPFASDPFSDSISTTSVSSTSSNDPFTSAFTSQKSSHMSVDASDDPFSVFDNTFEPFHFEKSKKSKVKLKQQAGQ